MSMRNCSPKKYPKMCAEKLVKLMATILDWAHFDCVHKAFAETLVLAANVLRDERRLFSHAKMMAATAAA